MHHVTERQTERRTDRQMMMIADHILRQYDRLKASTAMLCDL